MQGTISFDGTLSGGITGGGGGGSEVTITPVLTEGEKIADYSIDGESGSLYAPEAEALPSTIVTKALRKYNDTSQTKILTITTLDTENSQEVSQDIYAPSPVQCWYTPGLEQDYVIGQFTYGGVTQNVYIPDFQRPLTAGANITIDQDNVISASSGGSSWNYSTSEIDTGQKWTDNKNLFVRTFQGQLTISSTNRTWYDLISNLSYMDKVFVMPESYIELSDAIINIPYISLFNNVGAVVGSNFDTPTDTFQLLIGGIPVGTYNYEITLKYTKVS